MKYLFRQKFVRRLRKGIKYYRQCSFAIVETLIRPSVSRKFFPLLCVFSNPQYLQYIHTLPCFFSCYHKYIYMNNLYLCLKKYKACYKYRQTPLPVLNLYFTIKLLKIKKPLNLRGFCITIKMIFI